LFVGEVPSTPNGADKRSADVLPIVLISKSANVTKRRGISSRFPGAERLLIFCYELALELQSSNGVHHRYKPFCVIDVGQVLGAHPLFFYIRRD
jgi:hypothetical protein